MLGSLNPAEIEELLRAETVARIGCHASGRTDVVPISYAYDGAALVGHSTNGLKLSMMRDNPAVCVEVDHVENLANWRSVIPLGHFEERDGAAALAAMSTLSGRFRPLTVSETSQPSHGLLEGETTIFREDGGLHLYRILLSEKTGRFERR